MLSEERRRRLLETLDEQGALETVPAARQLGVSEMTIRRDLADLERRGLVRRVHGGAQTTREADVGYLMRLKRNPHAKQQVGALAARQVCSHETIYLDAGTTCMELARALKRRDLRGVNVLTHAVNIAAELAGHPSFTVIQVGGEIYAETFAATGPTALATIGQFSFDRMFLSAQGLHPKSGITNSNLLEVAVKTAAMSQAAWIALVVDASKWNRQALARIAGVGALSVVISDDALPDDARTFLRASQVEVLVS